MACEIIDRDEAEESREAFCRAWAMYVSSAYAGQRQAESKNSECELRLREYWKSQEQVDGLGGESSEAI